MKGGLDQLKAEVAKLRKKLNDADDEDDPRWVKSWIAACEAEIAKKEAGKKLKTQERREVMRRRRKT
jgi:hypothetical protein